MDWCVKGLTAEADSVSIHSRELVFLHFELIDDAAAHNVLRTALVFSVFYNYINLLASFEYIILIKMREMKEGQTNDFLEDKSEWCSAGIFYKGRKANRDTIG